MVLVIMKGRKFKYPRCTNTKERADMSVWGGAAARRGNWQVGGRRKGLPF